MLANLLGHWPQYEIRVRPVSDYSSQHQRECKATLYLGTSAETEVPAGFLDDFFRTDRQIAWIGFGTERLDQQLMARHFGHRVSGQVGIDGTDTGVPGFYQHVSYKGSLFSKSVSADGSEGAFSAVRYLPVGTQSRQFVVADLIHNKSFASNPYFLRSANRFIVGDIPFSYMHEGDRYFAFADLLFDILDEKPLREAPLAFARTEDIHGHYDLELLRAAASTLRAEGVPVSIAHIPLFMDPFDVYGLGKIDTPDPASANPEFVKFVGEVRQDPRNAIVWHGVTHQLGVARNPHSGTSGDDYEFWDMVAQRPVAGDGVPFTVDRLAMALPVMESYGIQPRYWVTPHYHASAVNNRVLAEAFSWSIGRVTYYPSSFKSTFVIPAAADARERRPTLTRERLEELKTKDWPDLDFRSDEGLTQMFPFEIYRDVYGQRIVPETLGYLSYSTTEQTAFIRTAEDMLADAQRSMVLRDYWASFFYHPYLFAKKSDGGVGRHTGDTLELRKLLVGLKLLGYRFVGLPEFEDLASGATAQSATSRPASQDMRTDG